MSALDPQGVALLFAIALLGVAAILVAIILDRLFHLDPRRYTDDVVAARKRRVERRNLFTLMGARQGARQ